MDGLEWRGVTRVRCRWVGLNWLRLILVCRDLGRESFSCCQLVISGGSVVDEVELIPPVTPPIWRMSDEGHAAFTAF